MAEKILIVDDEPDTLSLLSMTLMRAGYTIFKAATAKAALEIARKETLNLVILDLMLPDASGVDVLKTLRAERNALPVILFTARGRVEDVNEGLAAGAYQYLIKPTSREKLLETVKAALSAPQ